MMTLCVTNVLVASRHFREYVHVSLPPTIEKLSPPDNNFTCRDFNTENKPVFPMFETLSLSHSLSLSLSLSLCLSLSLPLSALCLSVSVSLVSCSRSAPHGHPRESTGLPLESCPLDALRRGRPSARRPLPPGPSS